MKVELLIYAYLAVCGAMIIFNIVCIFVFRRRDKNLEKHSKTFENKIKEQIKMSAFDTRHIKYLSRKLCKINNLIAFDKTLDSLYKTEPEKTKKYIEELSPVFIYLTLEYRKKDKLKVAYFPYIIKKYGVFRGNSISIVSDIMLDLVRESSLYCRENALQALYSIGNCEDVIKALFILDGGTNYHNPKLVTDGLLSFTGDEKRLAEMLWQKMPKFSVEMSIAILNYFRYKSSEYCDLMLQLMSDPEQNAEVRYSCIRYFGKYKYDPAFPYLLSFAENESNENWEYAAIASSALSLYPSDETVSILKEKLSSRNWYVRFNAATSLTALGLEYSQLIDVFEGDDRYAVEMLRYRFDRKKLHEKEVTTV